MPRSRRRRARGESPASLAASLLGLLLLLAWLRDPTAARLAIGMGVLLGLVLAVGGALAYRNAQMLRRAGIAEIDRMDGGTFERKVGSMFAALGYRTRVTRQSGDFGADVVAARDGERLVIQAKCFGADHRVGVSAVQEAAAAVAYYRANRAVVVTNREFTRPARDLAAANGVELWDRGRLVAVLARQHAGPGRGAAPAGAIRANGPASDTGPREGVES